MFVIWLLLLPVAFGLPSTGKKVKIVDIPPDYNEDIKVPPFPSDLPPLPKPNHGNNKIPKHGNVRIITNEIVDKSREEKEERDLEAILRKKKHYFTNDVVKDDTRALIEKMKSRKMRRNKIPDVPEEVIAREDILKNSRQIKTQIRTIDGNIPDGSLEIDGVTATCELTQTEKNEALDIHRYYRETEHASNMWLMDWDESLAELAQGLVNTCVFKHTNLHFANGTRTGQNLGAKTGNDATISEIVNLFYNEKEYYDYENHQWTGVVGHFLQLSYWQTVSVGCAKNFCPKMTISTSSTQETWDDVTYWACSYWPPVTYKERPYEDGNVCSECVVPKGWGYKCVTGTCTECKLDGSDSECVQSKDPTEYAMPDQDAMCPYASIFGWCSGDYYKWALENCQTTCGLCKLVPEKLELV